MTDMKQIDFENGTITGNIINAAVPMLTAQVLSLLYNIVDRIYIARIPGIGSTALGAVGLCFPVIIIITAFSNLFGGGGAPLFAIQRGMGHDRKAGRIMNTSYTMLCGCAVLLMSLGLVFAEPLLKLFGASEAALVYVCPYMMIYLLGTFPSMATTGLNPFINAQGYATTGMLSITIGAVANLILDPIFIYVLHMNVAGAALATIISQFVSCIWVLSFLFGKKTIIKIRKEYLLFDKNIMKKILGLGFTPFFMSSTEGILQVAFNRQLLLYGGDLSVSAMTILLSMSQILSLPMEGIAQGAQPIISYNFGAKKYDRVKETIKITIKVALTYSIIGVLLMEAFPQVFVSLFANNTQLIQLSYQLLRIYIFGFIIMGAFSTFQQTYNALGCGKNAFFFAFFRKIILLIPLIYLLPFILPSYGVYAVVLAEPISDLMTTILNGIYFKHFVKKTLA